MSSASANKPVSLEPSRLFSVTSSERILGIDILRGCDFDPWNGLALVDKWKLQPLRIRGNHA
jgi:hypothetical protein